MLLVFSSICGCRSIAPTIETKIVVTDTYRNEYLKTLIELDECQQNFNFCIDTYKDLFIQCEKKDTGIWKEVIFDTLKPTAKQKLMQELSKPDTVYKYKGVILPTKEKIKYNTPIWAIFSLIINFLLILTIIMLIVLGIKIVKDEK
jgi:hypothetical protein